MERIRIRRLLLAISVCSIVANSLAGCETPDQVQDTAESNAPAANQTSQTERDIAQFQRHLADKHPGELWMLGPRRLDSPEIQKAYPGFRFYFVSSPHPMPRGARPAQLPTKVQAGSSPKRPLTLCVRFGSEGKLVELSKPADYSPGLAPIISEQDARFAAAAILSTMDGYYFGPSPLSNSLVKVESNPDGWTCRLRTRTQAGKIAFDRAGACISVSMRYVGSFPP